ncbi:MAG: hypothetical protein PVS2B3_10540 [Steroidobacteraceae bacterium]
MYAVVLSALGLGGFAPFAEAQVSVNAVISGQVVPGVYGQVVIGNGAPPPPLVYAQPVLAQPAPVVVGEPVEAPLYLHVPPGHARHWRKHCHEYNACNRPVYFVRSAEYDPGYRPDRGHDEDDQGDHGHGHHDHGNHGHRDD